MLFILIMMDMVASASEQACIVCFGSLPTFAFQECGHMCLCEQCKTRLEQQPLRLRCPMCRSHSSVIKIRPSLLSDESVWDNSASSLAVAAECEVSEDQIPASNERILRVFLALNHAFTVPSLTTEEESTLKQEFLNAAVGIAKDIQISGYGKRLNFEVQEPDEYEMLLLKDEAWIKDVQKKIFHTLLKQDTSLFFKLGMHYNLLYAYCLHRHLSFREWIGISALIQNEEALVLVQNAIYVIDWELTGSVYFDHDQKDFCLLLRELQNILPDLVPDSGKQIVLFSGNFETRLLQHIAEENMELKQRIKMLEKEIENRNSWEK